MPTASKAGSRAKYAGLFLLHGIAMAAWFVTLGPVLEAHGYGSLRSYAFATSAIAALVTPLLFGALADRHAPPLRVLRWVSVATAALMFAASWGLGHRWSPLAVLAIIQALALVLIPTWSLLTSIVIAGLGNARKEFGPVRAFGTFGWIIGCLLVSVLQADAAPRAGYMGAIFWLALAAGTALLPDIAPPPSKEIPTMRERLGLDALGLLRHREHRGVILTAGLLSAPLAAFYPFAPAQLRDLGLDRTSAWMSLAQVSEVVAMFGLAGLIARWGIRWVLGVGVAFATMRYVLMATDSRPWVLMGVSLHGVVFTLFFITGPIYLKERIDPAWRTRAQALFSLMTQGLGSLAGYLGSGWWLHSCTAAGGVRWSQYWGGLAVVILAVSGYFIASTRPNAQPGSALPR